MLKRQLSNGVPVILPNSVPAFTDNLSFCQAFCFPLIFYYRILGMRVFLFAATVFFAHGSESGSKKCSSQCDVSACPSPTCPSGYVPDRCNCCLVCSRGEDELCGRKNDRPCGEGLECRSPNGPNKGPSGKRSSKRRLCQCKMGYKVCGSDGKTYGNVCRMKAASRKALQKEREAITQAHKGPCPSGKS